MNTVVKEKPVVKLTEYGSAVAKILKARTEENIQRHNGEYVPDPWYRCYLSPDFVIPEQKPIDTAKLEMEAAMSKSKSKRAQKKKEKEDVFEEDMEEADIDESELDSDSDDEDDEEEDEDAE